MDTTLTLARLDEMAAANPNPGNGVVHKIGKGDILRLIEAARERVARERCQSFLRPTEAMNLDCGLIDFEASASDPDGCVVRGQGDTASDAWLALGDALEKKR